EQLLRIGQVDSHLGWHGCLLPTLHRPIRRRPCRPRAICHEHRSASSRRDIVGSSARGHPPATTMDVLKSHLDFLASHPFAVVFCSSLIEAAGIPFPSRVILILAPAFLATDGDLVRLILVATIGSVLGDHGPYLAGRLAGLRMLALYCKLTLASDRC